MARLSKADVARLRDVAVFAERLIGEPLWPHQAELASSPARFRLVLAGRQVGKSRTLAVVALHHAFTKAEQYVLLISAGEDAAKDLLQQVAGLATASPWLGGSVAADDMSKVVLSNGSVIRCVPASQRQVRGKSVDLLILDEGCFIEQALWDAARFTILARPGSRVVMASTPYGKRDKFFATMWRLGMAGEPGYASWHWPSTVSPAVDLDLIEQWRRTDNPRTFAREVLAEWPDDQGAYFTAAELDAMTGDHELVTPAEWSRRALVSGGVDWGFSSDANALTVVAGGPFDADGHATWWVPWVEERFGLPYAAWIDRIVEIAEGYPFARLVCETNGVGQMPSQILAARMAEAHRGVFVDPVSTTAALKENAFGFLKLLAQQGRFKVPRVPALLAQLAGLEFETSETGATRIAVPDRVGHDDLVMSLALAVLPLMDVELPPVDEQIYGIDDVLGVDDDWSDGWISLY